MCPASTPTLSCSTCRILLCAVALNSCIGRDKGLWCSLPFGFFSTSSKRSRVFPLPVVSSKVRSLRMTFFVGMAAFALSSLSAALSERSMYFFIAGSARSSSVNCKREEGRRLAAEPSLTALSSAFACFFAERWVWCSAARAARSTAALAGSSDEADKSTSGSRWLIFVTSPVARFSVTAPSWVIFCITLSGAFNSFIGNHRPFHRGRYPHKPRSLLPRYSGRWDMPGEDRPHSQAFSVAGRGRPSFRSYGGRPRVLLPRGYVRPSLREAHQPFHPIGVQG